MRESVLDRLVKSGHPETVKRAQELFEKYLKGDSDVPSEIRRAVREKTVLLSCLFDSAVCFVGVHCGGGEWWKRCI